MRIKNAIKKLSKIERDNNIASYTLEISNLRKKIKILKELDENHLISKFFPFENEEPDSMGIYHCRPGTTIWDAEYWAQNLVNLTKSQVIFSHNERTFIKNPE